MLLVWQSVQARVAWTPTSGKVEWVKVATSQLGSVALWQVSQVVGKLDAACGGVFVAL